MSPTVPIGAAAGATAPTPQNTPLNQAPINLGLSRPTVPDISEEGDEIDEDDPSIEGLKETMMDMVEGKLATLLGKSSGYIETLPVEIKLNVEALKGLQVKQNELHQKYKLECLELEKKYLELQKPLFDRRQAIMNGQASATPEEIEAGEKAFIKDDEDYQPLSKEATPSPSGIPQFWLTALRNHVGLSDLITDRDAEALKHLLDVRMEYLKEDDEQVLEAKGKPGYRILFHFGPNDYFENDILVKTYVYQEEVGYWGDFVYDRAFGTTIKWKEDKDLTKEFEIKKQRNKNTNRTRLIRKARNVESFFNFFSPPDPPSEETIEKGELDDEELEDIEEKLEVDYQIGEDLKEKIIPRAIDYFTGKALEYEVEDDDDEFSDEEGDDDAEIEESDEDVPVPRFNPTGKPRVGPPSGKKPQADECKTQ